MSAMIGVRAPLLLGLDGADAAHGFDAVHARHMQVHEHAIIGRAGGARGDAAVDRGGARLPPWSDDGRA